jgi:hypothetical protein
LNPNGHKKFSKRAARKKQKLPKRRRRRRQNVKHLCDRAFMPQEKTRKKKKKFSRGKKEEVFVPGSRSCCTR